MKNEVKTIVSLCAAFMLGAAVPMCAQAAAKDAAAVRQKMIAYSKQYLGIPYREGGIDSRGMDCSGFLFTVAKSAGKQLPRTTSELYATLEPIADSDRQPGDVLFFRTVNGRVSHAGLYLGGSSFIHSASEGPETGVITSSLTDAYWSTTYTGAGRFLPVAPPDTVWDTADTPVTRSPHRRAEESAATTGRGFSDRFAVDGTLTADWTFFSTERFMLLTRGASLMAHVRYKTGTAQGGLGVGFTYDPQLGLLRIPIVLSLSLDDIVRVYAGPIISIGDAVLPDTDTEISPSVFPGIIGVAFQLPPIRFGRVSLAFVQDVHYTVCNRPDDSALSPGESLSAGLVLATGVRLQFPSSH